MWQGALSLDIQKFSLLIFKIFPLPREPRRHNGAEGRYLVILLPPSPPPILFALRVLNNNNNSILLKFYFCFLELFTIILRIQFYYRVFLLVFNVLYSALFHLTPLRFCCVGGCWDRFQDSCDLGLLDALTTRLDLGIQLTHALMLTWQLKSPRFKRTICSISVANVYNNTMSWSMRVKN